MSARAADGLRSARFLLAPVLVLVLGRGVASAAPFAYVPNSGDGNVTVIDTATSTVVATVIVGEDPLGAALDAAGTRAYIANQVTPIGSVSVIDVSLNGVVATVTVGSGASGVAAKLPGDRVYVTNRDDKTVSVIDTGDLAVAATVTVGNNPLGVAVNPAGNPAYVVNKGSNSVTVVDTAANAVAATIPVGNDPTHVAVSPDGHRVYVTNSSNASVSVIDSGINAVIITVPVGNIPEGVAVHPLGTRVYVANSGPNNVSVIDTSTHQVVATIPVGLTPFELSLRPDGARLFVANKQGGTVSVIDTASNTVTTTVNAGSGASGFGQFIAPGLVVPEFGTAGRKCQVALAREAAKLAKKHFGLEIGCQTALIKAEASGKGTGKAELACHKALARDTPTSKLSRAQAKARTTIVRRCVGVATRQINRPCVRSATDFGGTAACLVDQHFDQVVALRADEFSATRPVLSDAGTRACQAAITKNGRRFADFVHKELGKCLEKVLTAADAGKNEFKALIDCRATVDLGNPLSKATLARDKAVLAIVTACAGRAPAALGSPCDPIAPSFTATAACILDGHAAHVAKMIAAEYNDACVILTSLGLAGAHPSVCFGP